MTIVSTYIMTNASELARSALPLLADKGETLFEKLHSFSTINFPLITWLEQWSIEMNRVCSLIRETNGQPDKLSYAKRWPSRWTCVKIHRETRTRTKVGICIYK